MPDAAAAAAVATTLQTKLADAAAATAFLADADVAVEKVDAAPAWMAPASRRRRSRRGRSPDRRSRPRDGASTLVLALGIGAALRRLVVVVCGVSVAVVPPPPLRPQRRVPLAGGAAADASERLVARRPDAVAADDGVAALAECSVLLLPLALQGGERLRRALPARPAPADVLHAGVPRLVRAHRPPRALHRRRAEVGGPRAPRDARAADAAVVPPRAVGGGEEADPDRDHGGARQGLGHRRGVRAPPEHRDRAAGPQPGRPRGAVPRHREHVAARDHQGSSGGPPRRRSPRRGVDAARHRQPGARVGARPRRRDGGVQGARPHVDGPRRRAAAEVGGGRGVAHPVQVCRAIRRRNSRRTPQPAPLSHYPRRCPLAASLRRSPPLPAHSPLPVHLSGYYSSRRGTCSSRLAPASAARSRAARRSKGARASARGARRRHCDAPALRLERRARGCTG